MASYGTVEEGAPILKQSSIDASGPVKKVSIAHPLPGQGGWGEKEWRGATSMRRLRRPLWDPALYAVDDYLDEVVQTKFTYLKESGWQLPTHLFSSRIPTVPLKQVLIGLLLGLSIFMDGIRPIVLVYAKGEGNASYPFMFSVWVVFVKLLTVIFSLFMYFAAKEGNNNGPELSLGSRIKLSVYFLVPVLCYVSSDIINFVLFERHISPTLFACVKQSRIILTAVFFRFILKRNVSAIQWIAISQLALASVLFVSEDLKTEDEKESDLTGIWFLLFKCLLDSVAVVWMDKYFKSLDDAGFPYVEQQVVFSVYSMVAGIVYVAVFNFDEVFSGRPFFEGFNEAAWLSAFLTAFYGILVSLLLKYLDSMVKQFQALASIVVTTLLDQMVFNKTISLTSWVAIIIILISVFLYKLGAAPGKIHSE